MAISFKKLRKQELANAIVFAQQGSMINTINLPLRS